MKIIELKVTVPGGEDVFAIRRNDEGRYIVSAFASHDGYAEVVRFSLEVAYQQMLAWAKPSLSRAENIERKE